MIRNFFLNHRARSVLLPAAFLMLGVAESTYAAFGFKMDGTLDKEAISHAYFEGEFNRVLPPLETFRQSFPGNATREDSIFVYKYLSVIYAADSSTRIKGESYMVQLIKIMPTIELIDLYISDNIQAIFRNVKTSYFQEQKYVSEHDAFGNQKSQGDSVSTKKPQARNWIWWTLGGVGTAAAVTGAIVVLDAGADKPKSSKIRIEP